MSSTCTDENNPCFQWPNRHSQFGTFSHRVPIERPQSVFPTSGQHVGVRANVFSRGTVGPSMSARDFGHLCRGRRIHTSGHSDLGILSNLGASSIFTWVWRDTVAAACPAQSSSLTTTSITFCSCHFRSRRSLFCKYCISTWVVFRNVSSEHDSSIAISGTLVLTPHSCDDRRPSVWQSGRSVSLFLLPESFLALHFIQIPRSQLFELLPFLVNCSFSHREFSSLAASE